VTFDNVHDARVERLELLTPLTPDPDRTARVRVRCREQLERSRRRTARADAVTRFTMRVVAPIVIGGVCVLYVAALVATTLRFQSAFY
jgi:hypothetical protein